MEKSSKEMFDKIKCCATCVFCMVGNDEIVCAGRTDEYGFPIDKMKKIYPNGCEEYEVSIHDYIDILKEYEKTKNRA